MAAKRALVVDDSKSARTSLAKMLEKYELEVVGAESAEQAIEYLAHHRPDVIFMDHLMPGMDGFQAVQAIKNNPRTATIPIMMYTSQEGELYVSQARALGAVGVLPKQIRPADVSKVLYQLHLLPDRRSDDSGAFRQVGSAVELLEDGETTTPVPRPTDLVLREHLADLRRSLTSTLDGHAERLRVDLHAALRDALGGDASGVGRTRRAPWGWTVALSFAFAVAIACLIVAGRQMARNRVLAGELTELRAALASLRSPSMPPLRDAAPGAGSGFRGSGPVASAAQPGGVWAGPGPRAADDRTTAPASTRPIVEVVPYGEEPLGGSRLESLRQLFSRLVARGFRGTVEIEVFPGRFCMMGNAGDGFSLATNAMPYARCDVVGPPQADTDAPASQRVPVTFADLAAELRTSSHGTIDVQVLTGDGESTLVAYPPVSDSLTAGDWNHAAAANNRIEIRLR